MTTLKPQPDFLIFDFETLSHRPQDAMVVSFGAITGKWSDACQELREKGYYRNIDTKGQKEYGLFPTEQVVQWWKKQPSEVSSILTASDKVPLIEALIGFNEWCLRQGVDSTTTVWIRAPHFDFTIINNLYEKVMQTEKLPFSHWMVRDARTACDILYKTNSGYAPNTQSVFDREGIIQHNALEDCLKEFLQIRPYFLKPI